MVSRRRSNVAVSIAAAGAGFDAGEAVSEVATGASSTIGSQRDSSSAISARVKGLGMKSSMPASRHSSTDSASTLADIETMVRMVKQARQMVGPDGTVMFDARGNYALILAKVGMPKFASDNRTQGSAEENRAVVQGTLAHFGTYKVDERQRTLNFHIVGSTFPNWEGNDQLRPLSITGNVAKWTTPEASGGGVAELVIRRQR